MRLHPVHVFSRKITTWHHIHFQILLYYITYQHSEGVTIFGQAQFVCSIFDFLSFLPVVFWPDLYNLPFFYRIWKHPPKSNFQLAICHLSHLCGARTRPDSCTLHTCSIKRGGTGRYSTQVSAFRALMLLPHPLSFILCLNPHYSLYWILPLLLVIHTVSVNMSGGLSRFPALVQTRLRHWRCFSHIITMTAGVW